MRCDTAECSDMTTLSVCNTMHNTNTMPHISVQTRHTALVTQTTCTRLPLRDTLMIVSNLEFFCVCLLPVNMSATEWSTKLSNYKLSNQNPSHKRLDKSFHPIYSCNLWCHWFFLTLVKLLLSNTLWLWNPLYVYDIVYTNTSRKKTNQS